MTRKTKRKPEPTTLNHSNVYWRSVRAVMVRLYDEAPDHKKADFGRIARMIQDADVYGSVGMTTIEMTVEQRDLIKREARV